MKIGRDVAQASSLLYRGFPIRRRPVRPTPADWKSATQQAGSLRYEAGAVLLEVVLALVLFVAAVAVVSSALHASMESVQRQRATLQAANLAATVHAELDIGIRATDRLGPEPFPAPFDAWNWQLSQSASENESGDASGLTRVEVIIRNTNSPSVYRLAQLHKIQKTVVPSVAP